MTEWRYFEAAILATISIASLTGNISLFLVVYRNQSLQKTSNYFTLNLASADILVSLVNMPVTIYTIIQRKWLLGELACSSLAFVNILSFVLSVMSLGLIAINRYFFVVQWKKYRRYFNLKRVTLYIAFNWIISVLLSLPPFFNWASFGYVPGKSYCFVLWRENPSYAYFMVSVCFLGPLVTMFICYFKILMFTKNAKRKIQTGHTSGKSIFKNVSPEESRITNTLLMVLGVFFACWAPFATTMFFEIYADYPLPRWIDMGSLLLGYTNSLCNPIIYSVRNRQIREAFFDFYGVCRMSSCKRQSITSRAPCENSQTSTAHHDGTEIMVSTYNEPR